MSTPIGYTTIAEWSSHVGRTASTITEWCRQGLVAGACQPATNGPWLIPVGTAPPERGPGGKRASTPGYLPASPLAEWIRRQGGHMVVAEEAGLDPGNLRRLAHQRVVTEVKADRIVSAFGAHLRDVYENYDDLVAAW